jgi:hypothetical protein
MAISFDGDNLVITLESGVTEVNVYEDLLEDWKDWMLAHPDNRKYPPALLSDGGKPLTSIINQGSYVFLNNIAGWRIKPPEEDITIYLTGNLAVDSTELPALVPTDGAFTAAVFGLQPVTQGVTPVMAQQLRHAAFNGGVWIDETNGDTLANIGDEGGTEKYPLNNYTDGLAVAAAEGFGIFYVMGDSTLPSGLSFTNKTIIGQGKVLTELTLDPGATITHCTFAETTLAGTLDGQSHVEDSIINGLSYVSGVIERCSLTSSLITLGGAVQAELIDCESGVAGESTPEIDCGGSGQSLLMHRYSGGIALSNKTGVDDFTINLAGGQLILKNTVTSGKIVARGVGKLIDESGNRISTGTWNGVTIVNELVDYLDTRLARQWAANRVTLNADKTVVTMYEDDGTTVAAVMNVTADGLERTPA